MLPALSNLKTMATMIDITLSKLRRRLGFVCARVNHTGNRVMILNHGKIIAALVPASDYDALEEADAKSLQYKEYQMAEQMQRWIEIKKNIALERERERDV